MAYDEALAARIRRVMARRRGQTERRMFGGICFQLNGNICCGVWQTSLILRLGPSNAEAALRDPQVRPFDITGKAMKGWVMVAAEGLQDDEVLAGWIGEAITFVRTLPAQV